MLDHNSCGGRELEPRSYRASPEGVQPQGSAHEYLVGGLLKSRKQAELQEDRTDAALESQVSEFL